MPVALVGGFAEKLRSGGRIPNNPAGSRILSDYLKTHGKALTQQLGDLPDVELIAPDFPERPGMIDVLGYIGDFAAVAAIIAVAELCLPITLYVMTYLSLFWELHRRSPARKPQDKRDGFGGMIDPPEHR